MSVSQDELISQIEKQYNIKVRKCIAGPQQVVALTFIIDDSTGKQYFCKVIDNSILIPVIVQTLPVVEQLYKNGIDKICYPVMGNKGLYFYMDSKLVVLYNYIPVLQSINYKLYTFGNMIAKVHAITPKITVSAPIESFEFPSHEFFNASFESILKSTSTDIVIQELKKLLQTHEDQVRQYIAEFMNLAPRCKTKSKSLVITHGDVINNILTKSAEDLYIIDWDELRLAPAERDVFMNDDNADFMAGYRSVRPDFVIDPELRRFCILQRYFERMNIYFAQILDGSASEEYRLNSLQRLAKGDLAGDCQAKLQKYQIKLATRADDEEISKLSVTAWQQAYTGIFEDSFLANLKWEPRAAGRTNFFKDGNKTCFVAIIDNKIIGFCDVGPARIEDSVSNLNSSYGEIYAIYVLQPYQSIGIGKNLYEKSVEYLQKMGFKSLVVWTLVNNQPAIDFYLRQGCNITSWRKNFEIDGITYSEMALVSDFKAE